MAPRARTWLGSAGHVRVLHVFDAVCNLVDENDEVVSLVAPQVGDGPFNVVVPPVKFPDYVKATDQAIRHSSALIVGGLAIDLASALVWNPCPPWAALRGRRDSLRRYAARLIELLREAAPPGSLAGLVIDLPEPASAVEAAALGAARAHTGSLLRGLLQGDKSLCREGAAGLAGLGGGLTPAGDDCLVGCMLAVWLILDEPEIKARWIAQAAAHHTTALSAAWLRAAARGECGAWWHRLFAGMIEDNELIIDEAAQVIMRQGHTSGADALAGFVALIVAELRLHVSFLWLNDAGLCYK